MKSKNKIDVLLTHGFNKGFLTKLNEGQVNVLYKKLVESKKENKEATTKTETKTYTDYSSSEVNTMKGKGQTINVKDGQVQPLPDGGIRVVQETDDIDNDDLDLALALQSKEISEKFESKAQQKYFWAKCDRSKGKEKEKWCKMAQEFSDKTSKKQFKTMPEKLHPEETVKYNKKKETSENYLDMVGKAYNKTMMNKISDIKPSISIEEQISEIIKQHLEPKMSKKDLLSLMSEQGSPTIAPPKPKTPTKPSKPSTPYRPKPGPKPAPKAGKDNLPNWLSFKSIGINLK